MFKGPSRVVCSMEFQRQHLTQLLCSIIIQGWTWETSIIHLCSFILYIGIERLSKRHSNLGALEFSTWFKRGKSQQLLFQIAATLGMYCNIKAIVLVLLSFFSLLLLLKMLTFAVKRGDHNMRQTISYLFSWHPITLFASRPLSSNHTPLYFPSPDLILYCLPSEVCMSVAFRRDPWGRRALSTDSCYDCNSLRVSLSPSLLPTLSPLTL